MAYIGLAQNLQTTAFGDLGVAQVTPQIQLQFPYNINAAEVATSVTGSGTVTFSQPFAVCSTGAAATSSGTLQSLQTAHYGSGQGLSIIFTAIYTTGVANSTQIVGAGNTQDGFFFGYNGAAFGINRRSNSVDNWTAQTAWNQDKMDGTGPSGITLDPTKGNVYKIQFQWLGFGSINFFIENGTTGQFVLVHRIAYPNLNTATSLLQPTFPLYMQALNTTNATNISVRSSSMSAFTEGMIIEQGLNFSVNASKSITTTLNAILTIRNDTTFAGITNRKQVLPNGLSICSGNTIQFFQIILNTTLGGAPAFANVSANQSCVSFDTAGTTITGGRQLFNYVLNALTNIYIDLSPFIIQMNPGDLLTVSGQNAAGGAQTSYCALNWTERF